MQHVPAKRRPRDQVREIAKEVYEPTYREMKIPGLRPTKTTLNATGGTRTLVSTTKASTKC